MALLKQRYFLLNFWGRPRKDNFILGKFNYESFIASINFTVFLFTITTC